MSNSSILHADGYHIHFYCEISEISVAQGVHDQLLAEVPEIEGAGPVRSRAIGPHPLPMFEAWFKAEKLDRVLRWAMQNRQGLSVMIHPLSGDDLADHRDHAVWLGKPLPLKLEIFGS